MNRIVGLDVGGANLKYASADAKVFPRRFPMWKTPQLLAEAIEEDLRREYGPVATLAVTMTGELADCFADRGVGVTHIVEHVVRAAERAGVGRVRFYGVDGKFRDRDDAVAVPDLVAAANWHALASEVACRYPEATLMIDVGSTTTDIVPLDNGSVATAAETDYQRLVEGSLVYVGCRRTPVCALLARTTIGGQESTLMNEVFATVDDARLVLGLCPPDPDDVDSADGQPRTRKAAANRLARMVGLDLRTLGMVDVEPMALQVVGAVTDLIGRGVRGVDRGSPGSWVLSGHGQKMVDVPADQPVIDLAAEWGRDVSRCAPSFAAARRWLATCPTGGETPAGGEIAGGG